MKFAWLIGFFGMALASAAEPGDSLFDFNPAFSTGVGSDPRVEMLGRYQQRVFTDKNFWIGPRTGFLLEQNGSAFAAGISATQWMLSAVGAQLSAEFLLGVSGARSGYRINPSFGVRLWHLGENGALAGEAGFQWDSRTLWGMRLGVLLEWGSLY